MHLLRALRNAPGYTVIALLTLALGIGLNTAMVSLVDGVWFRALPFPDAQQLVQVRATRVHGELKFFSEPELREIQAQSSAFETLTAIGQSLASLSEPGQPADRVSQVGVSADFFRTFGVQPARGRAFTPEETRQGANQVVLLSHAFWQQRFWGSLEALGKTLRIDGENVVIIGVMPQTANVPALWGQPDLWRPLNFTHDQLASRDYRAFTLVGRLKTGYTPAAAGASLAGVAEAQQREHPQNYEGLVYHTPRLGDSLTDGAETRLYLLLLALSVLVLLLACANLANLQLARATGRLRDLAVRSALGASRSRLVAHQLTESLALSCAGGLLGLGVASFLIQFLERNLLPGGQATLSLNPAVMTIALLVSVVSGVAFGILPAWLVSGMDLNTLLKQGSRGATQGRSHRLLRNLLIIGQVALALTLLAGAAMLQRGFSQFMERQPGWDTEKVLTAYVPLPESRYESEPSRVEVFERLEKRLRQIPGAEKVALASALPLDSLEGERSVAPEGHENDVSQPRAFHVMVTPGYFEALGIRLVEGRLFPEGMKASDPLVIVINESLAKRLWPGQRAIGRRLRSDDAGYITWSEVIGVVKDVDLAASVAEPVTRFQVYRAMVHEPWAGNYVVVRGASPLQFAPELRRAVADVDPDLAVQGLSTVRDFILWSQRDLRMIGKLLTGFAALGLLLAAVGLYGVVSSSVSQRTGEFGIRIALGADNARILRLVLGEGLRLTALGLLLGLGAAHLVSRVLSAAVPRLAGGDVWTLFSVSLFLILVSLVSCWFPSRRATRVDPMVALRGE